MAKTLTPPTTPDELREMLADSNNRQLLAKDPEEFQNVVDGYARTFLKKDETILAQAAEESQRQLADLLRAAKEEGFGPDAKVKAKLEQHSRVKQAFAVARAKGTAYNNKAPGAKIDAELNLDIAEMFQAAWWNAANLPDAEKALENKEKIRKIQASFGSDVPADGGFLVGEEFRSEVLRLSLEGALVRPYATVIPMSGLRLHMPAVDETSHVSSVRGGMVGYWTEEGAKLVATSAKFAAVMLEAKKLTLYCEVPNELPADATAFSAFLGQVMPEAIRWFEDDGFTSGSGVGEPLGWLLAQAMVQVDRSGNTDGTNPVTDGTISWTNVIDMYARMLPQSLGMARWVASIDSLPAIALTASAAGYPMWLSDGRGGLSPTLLGRPIQFTEKTPQLGTAGDLNFVDFSQYLIGDRQQMQASSSVDFKFNEDKTAYRIIERVDGRPWMNQAITPKNGGPTLSPFVQMNDAS
jgi:HK97 family phage major capsid protein